MVMGEICVVDVGIVGEMIVSVYLCGSCEDVYEVCFLVGGYLFFGLMDIYVYFESLYLLLECYVEIVFIQGIIVVFWDLYELVNVFGVVGVCYVVDVSCYLLLQVMVVVLFSVFFMLGFEMFGVDFVGVEMEIMFGWLEVCGVVEVMDMYGVLYGSEWMQEIVQVGFNSGKLIEGYVCGLSGVDLQVYFVVGVIFDYELILVDDVLEKLCVGLMIEICGLYFYLLLDIVVVLKMLLYFFLQIIVCIDDVLLDILLEKGGIIVLFNLLIEYGLLVVDVL